MLRPRLRGAAQAQPCPLSCPRRATHVTPRPPQGLPKRPRSTLGSSPRPKARDRPTSDPRRPVGAARDEATVERREPGQTDGRSGPGPQGTCRGDRGQGGADAGSPQAGAGRRDRVESQWTQRMTTTSPKKCMPLKGIRVFSFLFLSSMFNWIPKGSQKKKKLRWTRALWRGKCSSRLLPLGKAL
ncbi:translation initiation factor IF-2 isoform X1 [Marmota monax]|uniref:translation initiation factor IF-2 isoform X1 n=1 Tax=Marmota monax TaxID=9995 RepID=UPI001EAFBF2E|nr:translation initiation factor IF-2 isoform X1 [Marmota monax]